MRHLILPGGLEQFGGRRLFICLDFDGTLAPIRRLPGNARLSNEKRKILEKLVKMPGCAVAVVSGRALKDLVRKVDVNGMIYAADHGFSIKYGKKVFRPFFSPGVRAVMREYYRTALGALRGVSGVVLEDKGMSLAVHYRCIRKPEVRGVIEKACGLAGEDTFKNKIEVRRGKMCLEIRPRVPWDKGSAVAWLLLKVMKDTSAPFVPVYVGDDTTDEDAFKALKNVGITVRVGKSRESCAEYYLKDTSEVFEFLKLIAGRHR